MVIIFSSEKARNHLLEKGFVYTFRMKRRTMLGKDWMTDRRTGKKIKDVYITEVGHYEIKNLQSFADQSGFNTLKSWMGEIVILNWQRKRYELGYGSMGWLYLVQLRVNVPCPRCDGEGDIPESEFNWIRCPRCEGKKTIMRLGKV